MEINIGGVSIDITAIKHDRMKPHIYLEYQKGDIRFAIDFYFFEIYIMHRANDWLLTRTEEKNGKLNLILYTNPKYDNCPEYIFNTYRRPFFQKLERSQK